jgi:hypothetical protein
MDLSRIKQLLTRP